MITWIAMKLQIEDMQYSPDLSQPLAASATNRLRELIDETTPQPAVGGIRNKSTTTVDAVLPREKDGIADVRTCGI